MQEPPPRRLETNARGKAAVWVGGSRLLQQVMEHREHIIVRVKVDHLLIYSCYAAPSMLILEYCNILNRLARDVKEHNPKIFGDDFNVWQAGWGSREIKGKNPSLHLHITLANAGIVNTFRRRELGSIMDLTFVSDSLAKFIHGAAA